MATSSPTLVAVARDLRRRTAGLRFPPPVQHVYHPLAYAWEPHRLYLERYGRAPKEVVFLGMNPGPWGMAQTGVPFGDVGMVRDWLGIVADVGRPDPEHPKRPIRGFSCPRGEVSGRRLWGWARRHFQAPTRFFERFFVYNYCPVLFLTEGGRNLTPDRLPAAAREPLIKVCDSAVRRGMEVLRPRYVIGVGRFAETRARAALASLDITIGGIPHPSPANPGANRGWEEKVSRELARLGIRVG
ncbi:MAG: single-stranded DNA-binding protein [Gemmatimonadetes bacterium]|nr:single-stranded DNA-binding protein [Gemmatimonadota bacterium]